MKENGLLEKYCPNPSCMIWDGFGGWVNNEWKERLSSKTKLKSSFETVSLSVL